MNPKTPRRRPPLPYAHAEPLKPRLFLSGTHYVADGLPDTVATDGLLTLRGTERLSIPGDDLHPGQPGLTALALG